jgi:hypothetical protein
MKHKWTSKKTYVPGEPDDWYCYCNICGDELNEDNRDSKCQTRDQYHKIGRAFGFWKTIKRIITGQSK